MTGQQQIPSRENGGEIQLRGAHLNHFASQDPPVLKRGRAELPSLLGGDDPHPDPWVYRTRAPISCQHFAILAFLAISRACFPASNHYANGSFSSPLPPDPSQPAVTDRQ